jgi:hypothetical protein
MGSIKEDLRATIEALSDSEAAQAVELIRHLQARASQQRTLELLARNPAVRVPLASRHGFSQVRSIRGEGVPASKVLIEDRR